jgi:tetratricopeptide (TPR) repeat protein
MMTDKNELSPFETSISRYYDRCKGKEDYFELLGISHNATRKQIESAYTEKIEQEFPRTKIENMTNPDIKEKAVFILQRIDYMYSQLINYEKRAQYEEKISREKSREDIKENPLEQARSNYKLGKSLYDQKAYPMALSALEEAVRLDPKKALYYHQLALCQIKEPSLRHEAEKNLQTAIELEPWNAEHHATLGMFYYLVKMNARAESSFRHALSLDPENAMAKKGLEKMTPGDKPSISKSIGNFLKKTMPTFFDK